MRVHVLAKELNITSKELIENVNDKLNLSLKSHSSTVGDVYIDKIRALYKRETKPTAKPKAFVVKKQKQSDVPKVDVQVEKTPKIIKTVSKLCLSLYDLTNLGL